MSASTPAESKSQPGETKRRQWSDEERDLIVRASLKKGTTVSTVARVYGVQPWQIYDWRKKAHQAAQESKAATLIPVHVMESDQADNVEPKQNRSVLVEAQGMRVTMNGPVDAVVLRTVLECLAR
jgi:transposase-like protein